MAANSADIYVDNDKIICFLKDRGYDDDVLSKVQTSRVCGESIHLMNTDDFTRMGIGLADCRLLMQKFCFDLSKSELKKIALTVRSKSKQQPGAKKRDSIIIEFGWQNYTTKGKKNKYTTVRIGEGGGLRRNKFARNMLLSEFLNHISSVFFPDGKSKEHGFLTLMEVSLIGTLNEKVEESDLSLKIDEYIDKHSLKALKFYLRTKSLTIALTEKVWTTSDSSDEDFEITPKKRKDTKGHSRGTESEENDDVSNVSLPSTNIASANNSKISFESINERRSLIQEQNEAFTQSLRADQERDCQKEEQRQVLKKRREQQQKELEKQTETKKRILDMLKEEPTLEDDCLLICVNHIEKGRMQRLFFADDEFHQVYLWIASVSTSSNFSLSFSPTSYVHPRECIKVAEKRTVNMNWVDDMIFKVGDTADVSTSSTSSNVCVSCAICGVEQPVTEIEQHASSCANSRFIEVIESDAESSDDPELHREQLPSRYGAMKDADLLQSLKEALGKVQLGTNGISLKVRRNHMFSDFCKRFSLPWVRKNIGSMIVITFYGESGVDQGGLRREFFSDAIEEGKQHMFMEAENGYIPRANCFGDIASGTFKLYGELLASSIAMNGPAPNFFPKWAYDYFIHGTKHVFNSGLDVSKDSIFGEFYYNLKDVADEAALQAMVTTDVGLDVLSQIGFKGVPHKVKMEDRDAILRSILLKERLQPLMIVLDQITEGLRLYGILDTMRSQPGLFEYVFCMSTSLDWNFEKFEKFATPSFSEDGSSKKVVEIDAFQAFMEFMELLFYEENDDHIRLADVMKFLCGVKSIPPLGLPSKLSILFKHWCAAKSDCRCKPSVSTCSLSLTLPVHYTSVESMKGAFFDALKMTQGFDL